MRIFEVALDLPAQYFAPFQDHSVDVLRLNRYAMPANASRAVTDQMGMGAHTDYGIVTVLWADQVVPGLQILGAVGRWRNVVPVTGALLVNLGRSARALDQRSLDLDRAPRIATNRSERISHTTALCGIFSWRNFDALIACSTSCQDADRPAFYEPVTVAEHLPANLAFARAAGRQRPRRAVRATRTLTVLDAYHLSA